MEGTFTITLESYDGKDAEIVVPDGIMKIGPQTFANNRYIKKVTIPMMPKANKAYGIVRLR